MNFPSDEEIRRVVNLGAAMPSCNRQLPKLADDLLAARALLRRVASAYCGTDDIFAVTKEIFEYMDQG